MGRGAEEESELDGSVLLYRWARFDTREVDRTGGWACVKTPSQLF